MLEFTEEETARFFKKIEQRDADECWPWVAKSRHKFGYGVLTISRDGRQKQFTASRVACFLAHGQPPHAKAGALHSCDNPICCNPQHLRWGTQKENAADAVERNRASRPPRNFIGRHTGKMPSGAQVHNQSLNEDQVREIWRLHLTGGINTTQIASVVGAKQHAVADVTRGKSWRHLPDAPTIAELKSGGIRRGANGFNELARRRVLEVRAANRKCA